MTIFELVSAQIRHATHGNYEEFREKVKKVESLFIEYGNPVEFLNYLEETAELCGISPQISNLYFKDGDKDGISTLTLKLVFVSEFSDFFKLLDNLKLAPWLLQIQSLDSNKTKDGIQTSILLKVFCKENGE